MAQLDLLTPAALPHLPDLPAPPKADGAYKTISEVADEIDVPQHVLRFWESRFPQVRPSRMRGARRYYRPEDVETLKTIKALLYGKGYTIEGARKVVRGKEEMPAPPLEAAPAAAPRRAAQKKSVDAKLLVSELRVLKSMLTSLL